MDLSPHGFGPPPIRPKSPLIPVMNRKRFLKSVAIGSAGLAWGRNLQSAEPEAETRPNDGSRDLSDWDAVRRQFPLTSDRVYLNTGGLGPACQPAIDAVQAQTLKQAISGEHFHSLLNKSRQVAARYFGAAPEELCFTRNATEANSIIAAGLQLARGDEVVFESHAHPGGSFPWLNRQKLDGVKVRIFEPSAESPQANLDRLFDQVNARTRVIQVSHITATTGLLFDAPAIAQEARQRGIWFHIDGAQSAGMIPINLQALGCDSYATSGHKWINGPLETGVLLIARDRIDEVACSHIGAYSNDQYELPDLLTYVDTAQRHEYGTRNAASVVGLTAAMELQEAIGRERVAQHGKRLAELARSEIEGLPNVEVLTPRRDDMRGSILTFRVPGMDCVDIYGPLLKNHRLRTRVVTERGLNAVRASWHVYHQDDDVQRFAEGLKTALG